MKPEEPAQDPAAAEGHGSRTLTDALRRAVVGGVGNLIGSEETLRAVVRELKVPKELVATLLSQAEGTKEEVVTALRRELRGFLSNLDAQALIQKALAGMVLELKAEVRFRQDENGDLVPRMTVGSGARRASSPREPEKAPRDKARGRGRKSRPPAR